MRPVAVKPSRASPGLQIGQDTYWAVQRLKSLDFCSYIFTYCTEKKSVSKSFAVVLLICNFLQYVTCRFSHATVQIVQA